MEEIDLKELFEFVKGKIGLLVIITVSVCLLGCIYGLFIQKPLYKSYTTVVLAGNDSGSGSNSAGITQSELAVNRTLVDTYAQIVKSRKVLDQVIDELGLDTTYNVLSNEITVTAVNNTEIIMITVDDGDAKRARNVANVTAKYFTKEVSDIYNMNNVTILDEAIEAKNPFNINVLKQVIIYFVIGMVLACGVLFVIFYFDRSIKSVEQIEQKIKLPILGSVQKIGNGGKK